MKDSQTPIYRHIDHRLPHFLLKAPFPHHRIVDKHLSFSTTTHPLSVLLRNSSSNSGTDHCFNYPISYQPYNICIKYAWNKVQFVKCPDPE